jgi:hypothetical protein
MLPGLTSSPPSGADTVARPRRILTGLPANIDTQGIMLVAGVERSRPCEASAAGSQCCACIFWPTRRRPPSGERTFPRTRASNRSIQAGRHAWRPGLERAWGCGAGRSGGPLRPRPRSGWRPRRVTICGPGRLAAGLVTRLPGSPKMILTAFEPGERTQMPRRAEVNHSLRCWRAWPAGVRRKPQRLVECWS